MSDSSASLTGDQIRAQEHWQARWNLPIIVAAVLPLFVTSPSSEWVAIVVGVGSWMVFVVDLVVQRRIVPDYLRRRRGMFDLGIVVLTFPIYLIPGVTGGTAILLLARLGRVVRVLLATRGLRRFAARVGKVAIVAALVVVLGSLAAYRAEHPANPEYATVGDALWWGIVTLTTVGYGDIVPKTEAGRLAGVAIMFTGIAVLGVLSGSLAAMFHLDEDADDQPQTAGADRPSFDAELAALQADLRAIEVRLGELAELARKTAPDAGRG
jgi:voltage-gated potassium channel